MTRGQMFFGGIPTEPDVKKLYKAYPKEAMTIGNIFPYEDIAKIIYAKPRTSRFMAVTNAWRKAIESDFNVLLKAGDPPGSFRVISDDEKVDASRGKLRSAGRAARRAITIGGRVDVNALDESKLKEHDFNVNKAGAILAVGQIRKTALPKINGEK